MIHKKLIGVLCAALLCSVAYTLDNGLARTPPMGWLAWERFRCVTNCTAFPTSCISEDLFVAMADQLVKLGLRDVGYQLVNIDDCWLSMARDNATGQLTPDPERFPHGIKWLADYMHQSRLKLGIYEDFGNYTCGGYPGSMGHLKLDAQTFADWGVDMLKLDGCYADEDQYAEGYPEMAHQLNATGRPIIYSCSWPAYVDFDKMNWTALGPNCNLWRLYGDIDDDWDDVYQIIQYWAEKQDTLVPIAGPGQWNDPDMLIIGDYSLSHAEEKVQFALWAIIAAPLFLSVDLRHISKSALEILKNQEIIAVNQDRLGIQGKRVSADNQLEVWVRPLADESYAVALFNGRSDGTPYTITANFTSAFNLTQATKACVRDLYKGVTLGIFYETYSAYVPPHDVVMTKITPVSTNSTCEL